MSWRKILFWIHLGAGLVAGLVILVMSVTGALIAFEKALVAWAEGDNRRVLTNPSADPSPRLQVLWDRVTHDHGRPPVALTVHADPSLAVEVLMGRNEVMFWDPGTEDLRPSRAQSLRKAMATLTAWHRWLGLEGPYRSWGKSVTGACNLAFVLLILTGSILWWPALRNRRAWNLRLWFQRGLRGRSRDWNWHHVVGFWCGPVLLILSGSAIVISYAWASRWVEGIGSASSSSAPSPRAEAALRSAQGPVASRASAMSLDTLWEQVRAATPQWERITIRFGGGRPGGPLEGTSPARPRSERPQEHGSPAGGTSPASRNRSAAENHTPPSRATAPTDATAPAVTFAVRERGAWPLFAVTQMQVHPQTGEVLSVQRFGDLPPGRRLRMWLRYLHTGEAMGWPGQLAAMGASIGGAVLVWTGLALSWRRFIRPRGRRDVDESGDPSLKGEVPGSLSVQDTDKKTQRTASEIRED
ncbi:MAG: PepSY-associated TM helix domain-containing protein [Limisphaera sp.]